MRFLLSLFFILSFQVWGAEEIQIPALSSPVVDQAALMSEEARADLANLAYEIYTNQGPQITVLTVPDLQSYAIEDFSIRVAEKWKLGMKDKGNGLLIIISKAERAMRIEVGDGIEGEITDFESNQYINNVLKPYFKEGDFHGGLKLVMEDVAKKFNIKLNPSNQTIVRRTARPYRRTAIPFPVILVVMGLFILNFAIKKPALRSLVTAGGLGGIGFLMSFPIMFLIILILIGFAVGGIGLHNILFALNSGGGRYHGGGGFGGGGGWSGSGGGFSGGGSSGNW